MPSQNKKTGLDSQKGPRRHSVNERMEKKIWCDYDRENFVAQLPQAY